MSYYLRGLGESYSVPITRPDFGVPVVYLPQANGRWFISWKNPDGTETGGYQNTNLTMDPHFVAPPDSVWDSLGVRPDYLVNPGKLTGNIQAADFNALHPFNPASVGSAATAPSTASAQGAPAVVGLQVEGSPAFTLPGTSVQVPVLPWWVWVGAAGAAWFLFGRGSR